MSAVEKIKKIYLISWIINLDCILQMIYLPTECINLYALWKSSPFLLFSFYYFLLYFKTMYNKENTSKYLSNKTVILYYADVLLKVIIIVFSLLFVKHLRYTENGIIGIIIQTALMTFDFISQRLVIVAYEKIYNKPVSERKVYLIEYKPIKCIYKDFNCVSKIILLSIVNVFIVNFFAVFLLYSKIMSSVYLITIISIVSDVLILQKYNNIESGEIKAKISYFRLFALFIPKFAYNIFSIITMRKFSTVSSVYNFNKLVIVYIIFIIFEILLYFIPMIKLNICMDKYLNKKEYN